MNPTVAKWSHFAACISCMIVAVLECVYISLLSVFYTTQTIVAVNVVIILNLIVASLGCCGALKKSSVQMIICGIFWIVTFIYYLLSVYVIMDHDGDKALAKSYVEEKWAGQVKDPDSMKDLQKRFKCCGKDSADDYENVLHSPIPKSCYSDSDELNKNGCVSAAEKYFVDNVKIDFLICVYYIVICIFAFYLAWLNNKKPFEQNQN